MTRALVSAPQASAVVPAHNAARTLPGTLRSIQAQTLADIEIIVVDDGSTDHTAGIVEAAARTDPRVRLVRQANAGVAAARNRGAAEARSDFLAFTDADDLWGPSKLERQLARFAEGGPEMALVYTGHCVIDGHDRIRRWSRREMAQGRVFHDMICSNLVGNGSSAMVRRSAFERVGGYDTGLREQQAEGCEDLKLYLLLSEHDTVGFVPDRLTGYRTTASSMSQDVKKMMRSHEIVLAPYRARFPEFSEDLERHSLLFRKWLLGAAVRRLNAPDILYVLSSFRGRPYTALAGLAKAVVDPALYPARVLLRSGMDLSDLRRTLRPTFRSGAPAGRPALRDAAGAATARPDTAPARPARAAGIGDGERRSG